TLEKLGFYLGPEALEPHRDRALADAHTKSDLARREGALEVEEAHGLLLGSLAQAVDHLADRAQLGLFLQHLRGRRDVVLEELRLAGGVFGGFHVRRTGSEVTARPVSGDGEEPGGEALAVLERG